MVLPAFLYLYGLPVLMLQASLPFIFPEQEEAFFIPVPGFYQEALLKQ